MSQRHRKSCVSAIVIGNDRKDGTPEAGVFLEHILPLADSLCLANNQVAQKRPIKYEAVGDRAACYSTPRHSCQAHQKLTWYGVTGLAEATTWKACTVPDAELVANNQNPVVYESERVWHL